MTEKIQTTTLRSRSGNYGEPAIQWPCTLREVAEHLLPDMLDACAQLLRSESLTRQYPYITKEDLASEATLRLADSTRTFANAEEFLRTFIIVAQRFLIDEARRKNAKRRGGGHARMTSLDDTVPAPSESDTLDRAALSLALERFKDQFPRQALVVAMRVRGEMTTEQIARRLDISERTVEGDWSFAKAFLKVALEGHR